MHARAKVDFAFSYKCLWELIKISEPIAKAPVLKVTSLIKLIGSMVIQGVTASVVKMRIPRKARLRAKLKLPV